MMVEEIPPMYCEDIQNVPKVMRNLDVRRTKPAGSCLSLKEICWCCANVGTGEPCNVDQRYLHKRKATFRGRGGVNGVSAQYLAESGFYLTPKGTMACYHCDQTLRLLSGEDPLEKHIDLYPNCQHVCKMFGRRPRSAVATMTTAPFRAQSGRRRLFSE